MMHKEKAGGDKERGLLDPERMWKEHPGPWTSWPDVQSDFVRSSLYELKTEKGSFWREFMWKSIISLILFGALWGMFRVQDSWAVQGQMIVRQALQEEMDFSRAALWYKQNFAGSPAFIPIFEDEAPPALDVNGHVRQQLVPPLAEAQIIRSFAERVSGIELAAAPGSPVLAMDAGRVLQVEQEKNERFTVIIQHANQRITVYGGLSQAAVAAGDWTEPGASIGVLPVEEHGGVQPVLYFAIKDAGSFVNPVDVVSFD